MSNFLDNNDFSEVSNNTLFEVVPPVKGEKEERFKRHCDYLNELFERVPATALNLPEINKESSKSSKGKRRNPYKERVSPRRYVRELSKKFDTNYVINRMIVKEAGYDQEEWLLETYHNYEISNVILVGGESSKIHYPGPSVTEGNMLSKEYLNQGKREYGSGQDIKSTNLNIGNICIPTRRRNDLDEPDRMINKVKSGADFFTTQIITESEYAGSLLSDFSSILNEYEVEPPILFWSFTPISEQKDIDFLRYLGVYIPDDVENKIMSSPDPAQESIEWAISIWEKLQEINEGLHCPIPMGINISVMGLRNFQNGIELAESLNMVEA